MAILKKYFVLVILSISLLYGCEGKEFKQSNKIRLGIISSYGYDEVIKGLTDEIEKSSLKDIISIQKISFAQNNEEFDASATILNSLNIDIVYAITTPAVKSAIKIIKDKPIIFNAVGDPISAGFAESYTKLTKNLTGVSNLSRELTLKRLEVFLSVFPQLKRIISFYNPENSYSHLVIEELRKAKGLFKVEIILIPVKTTDNVRDYLKVEKSNFDGIFFIPDPTVYPVLDELLRFQIDYKKPLCVHEEGLVKKGASIGYGVSFYELGRLSFNHLFYLCKGEKIEKIPIIIPDRVSFSINRKTLEKIGYNIPKESLYLADKVFEK